MDEIIIRVLEFIVLIYEWNGYASMCDCAIKRGKVIKCSGEWNVVRFKCREVKCVNENELTEVESEICV